MRFKMGSFVALLPADWLLECDLLQLQFGRRIGEPGETARRGRELPGPAL